MSVVVATRDRASLLGRCLDSIVHGTRMPDEIVVVDSVSTNPKQVADAAKGAGARLVRAGRPGAAIAHNVGILAAGGEVIAFTDDDAVVDPGWLAAIVEAYSAEDICASVGPVFVLDAQPTALLCPRDDFDAATQSVRFTRADPNWFDRLAMGAVGLGANLAARRSTFQQYGMFPEALGAGAPISGDETYFLLSLVERGGVVVNVPGARVYHPAQGPDRRAELQASALAYLLYVLATRPALRGSVLKRLALRLLRGRPYARRERQNSPAAPPLGLVGGLLSAPRRLIAAWRIEHP